MKNFSLSTFRQSSTCSLSMLSCSNRKERKVLAFTANHSDYWDVTFLTSTFIDLFVKEIYCSAILSWLSTTTSLSEVVWCSLFLFCIVIWIDRSAVKQSSKKNRLKGVKTNHNEKYETHSVTICCCGDQKRWVFL